MTVLPGFYNKAKIFAVRKNMYFRKDFVRSRILKIALRLIDRHVFMWQSLGILNVYNTVTFKQIIWKTKTFFKKLEYRFLVESTKIEKVTFPCKTALPEPNKKTSRMGSTKWIYHKERSFASNYFIFLKILFRSKNLS